MKNIKPSHATKSVLKNVVVYTAGLTVAGLAASLFVKYIINRPLKLKEYEEIEIVG